MRDFLTDRDPGDEDDGYLSVPVGAQGLGVFYFLSDELTKDWKKPPVVMERLYRDRNVRCSVPDCGLCASYGKPDSERPLDSFNRV